MKILNVILWLFGLELIKNNETPVNNQQQNESVKKSIVTPFEKGKNMLFNSDLQDSSCQAIIVKYQALRKTLDHDSAWKNITDEYGWNEEESAQKLEEITTYAKQHKVDPTSTIQTGSENTASKKDRTL